MASPPTASNGLVGYAELAAIAVEGKWSTGWKGFGRMLLEVLG